MTEPYHYVGDELDLFAVATRWKAYVLERIAPYLGDEVLEVGAGLGGLLPNVTALNQEFSPRRHRATFTVLTFLGLTVGKILNDLPPEKRRASYLADITYGTNNEFGFDYLRDNMKYRLEDMASGRSTTRSSTRWIRS